MSILIKNGTVVNPNRSSIQGNFDILIENDKIKTIAEKINPDSCPDAQIIDASSCYVMPGFVDMHAHLREPGQEYKEDIFTGTLAAIHGGYTSICCMPNTEPVLDSPAVLSFVKQKALEAQHCKVYPIASITKGLKGAELSEMGLLMEAGAIGFSDDGKPVQDPQRMRLALQYAKNFDALLMLHSEELSLVGNGVMHEGYYSTILGLPGIPAAAESAMIARDILLANAYDARIHICHVSTRQSVDLIRAAKADGIKVSCEATPHHFSATDEWVALSGYDSSTKMNPPLRSADDRDAIIEAIKDNTVDVIATDHAPHHADEKNVEYNIAINGIVGLETAFSLAVTNLLKAGHISPQQLVERMSTAPCDLLKLPGGELKEGSVADVVIANPDADIVYSADMLHSKSKNTPFLDRPYFGKIVQTIVDGQAKL